MVNEAFNFTIQHGSEDITTIEHAEDDEDVLPSLCEGPSRAARDFNDLLSDGEQELYPGCSKYSKLSFLVKLYHIKCMCGVSDKAMTMILDLLRDAFEQAKLPNTVYEARKTIRKVGIEYAKIDACPNDCMLYRGDDANLTRCKKCGCSRWKQKTKKGSILRLNVPVKRNGKPIAAKTFRYFPLIPRLQRLFMCSKTSSDMLWHSQASNNDGFLRHPRDAEAWKKFDAKYTNFSVDPRNVCVALASDGFNPFGNMSTKYFIWPVILIPYNLPPWLCIKQTSFILSTLIPGPKMPGNDIDIYLQPLIDELKQLWDGVETYDAKEGNTFKMCAALMWTISDFPGLGNLSGWNTHNGCNGQDVDEDDSHWKKKSVFFDLPYWEDQMLRHNLDVMHIEKNVCDNVVFTILNDSGKSKDNVKARRDLQCMGIRPKLWPGEGGKYPSAIFAMSNSQRDVFLKTLKNVVFPDGYSSNVARCVDLRQRKLSRLKSHDCHILMEQLLPILVKIALPSPVSNVIANLSSFFRELCGKAINPMQLAELQNHVVQILCQIEMIFPPSFFTVMVHLTVHLVDEVTLGGPVYYRWMYPIERAQPEGSIAEGYLSEEILTFCSRYLDNIETRINRPGRVDDEPIDVRHNSGESMFPAIGKALGAVSHFELSPMEKHQAHRHVLVNCDAVVPFLEENTKRSLHHQTRSQAKIDSVVHAEFPHWFKHKVLMESTLQSKDLQLLACGPMIQARRFGAYNVNGYKFRTISKENEMKTQNSGVYVSSNIRSYASMRDNRVAVGGVPYYRKIVDIIELNYSCSFTVVLFKCVWVDTTTSRGIKQDHLGLTSVNFSHPIHTGNREEDELYILASEAQLVYYVDGEVAKEWSVVVHVKPRDLYNMGEENEEAEVGFSPQPRLNMSAEGDIGDLLLTREENIGDLIENASENFDDVA
ncbi:uncharacterized protein LOC107607806 [Arachis ipaensis]|uniref:uncharacterized protein LOC107607806 n=1 Tax=Arachis ipaensis TaxID=130454 RepID=UPI0007AF3A8D|nr:uncharacterized protein LOC107607806 [Arachis ipaensis]XP_025665220.1 uncharacterized protein LOC112763887 [Arachis hypogaea]